MDLLKELLGFMVLTGPLLLILVWLPIAIWLARKLVKGFKQRSIKLGGGLLIFLLIFLVPFADEIAGRIYLSYLCATEAGVRVYQTVELPAEYWDEEGRANFYVGWDSHLGKKYPLLYKQGSYSSIFFIDNAGYMYVDKQSEKILGEVVDFRYWGGWIERNFSPHNTATTCQMSDDLINKIFKPYK